MTINNLEVIKDFQIFVWKILMPVSYGRLVHWTACLNSNQENSIRPFRDENSLFDFFTGEWIGVINKILSKKPDRLLPP